MSEITNEYMMEMLGKSKSYTIVLLKEGPNVDIPGVDQLIWEHARYFTNSLIIFFAIIIFYRR